MIWGEGREGKEYICIIYISTYVVMWYDAARHERHSLNIGK